MAQELLTSTWEPENFYTAYLTSDCTDSDTDIFLDIVPANSEGTLVIDPDSTTNREIIYYNSKTATKVTCPGNGRGYDNSAASAHTTGTKVIMAPIADWFNSLKTLFTTTPQGWSDLADIPDSVTYNGNRSYDLVFNSNDLTDTVSNGMRMKLTRTVTPPTQCTDLESGSSQYWSKTSPAGISFTTTFTCAAWIKLESYGAVNGIIARRNASTEGWSFVVAADGTINLFGARIASNNKQISSYQSIPLNKWVHVAACIDMTAGDTTAQKIWIDGVEVPRSYTLTGTATAIVQGTTALVVGSDRSSGANFFDGEIAQASVHSACLSDAQIKAMASQTISSSSPSIVSGFTFNGVATDVTANANDLTANGGASYGTDSPFNATEYGIITANSFSTNTTLTVQVPEGYSIPTTGGVSAVSYSTQDVPYGFPRDKGKWRINSQLRTDQNTTSNANYGSFMSGGYKLTVPIGAWKVGHRHGLTNSALTTVGFNVSDTSLTGVSSFSAGNDISPLTIATRPSAAALTHFTGQAEHDRQLTSATEFVMYTIGATTSANISGTATLSEIYAELSYL